MDDEDNEMSEPTSSHLSDNPEVVEYLSLEQNRIYIDQSSRSQYFLHQNSQEINLQPSCTNSFQGENIESCNEVLSSNNQVSSLEGGPFDNLQSRYFSSNTVTASSGVVSCHDSSHPDTNFVGPSHPTTSNDNGLVSFPAIPSTSKGLFLGKGLPKKFRTSVNFFKSASYIDSLTSSKSLRHEVESSEDKIFISPFKKRTNHLLESYSNDSSDSDDDQVGLEGPTCSSMPISQSKISKNILTDMDDNFRVASTSDQPDQIDDILNQSSPTITNENCLVSSSTGQLDAYHSVSPSVEGDNVSHSSDDGLNPPVLDSTVDSTSGQNVLSPYRGDSEDVRSSNDIFEDHLENDREQISTSHFHHEEVDFLVSDNRVFNDNRRNSPFMSLNTLSANSFHAGLSDGESNQGVATSFIPSNYFDNLAIPGPSGLLNISAGGCNHSSSSSPKQSAMEVIQNSLPPIMGDLQLQNDPSEVTHNFTSSNLEGRFLLDTSSENLRQSFGCRNLNSLDQELPIDLRENCINIEDSNKEVEINNKSINIQSSLKDVNFPIASTSCEVVNHIHSNHDLKSIQSTQHQIPLIIPVSSLLDGSNPDHVQEEPLGCFPPILKFKSKLDKESGNKTTKNAHYRYEDLLNVEGHENDRNSSTYDGLSSLNGECSYAVKAQSQSLLPVTLSDSLHDIVNQSSFFSKTRQSSSSSLNENSRKVSKDHQDFLQSDTSDIFSVGRTRQKLSQSKLVDGVVEEWSNSCECFLKNKCSLHHIQAITDKPVLKRAWASLPALYLSIKEVQVEGENICYGVFAKKAIGKRTQFGPLEGKHCLEERSSLSLSFPITYEQKQMFIDTLDEESSNWMRFVRKAENFLDLNCIIIEEEGNIYFLTTLDLLPKTELKLGYSQQYASKYGYEYLKPTDDEQKVLDSLHKTWACYECADSFLTSAELQSHLSTHDQDENSDKKKQKNRGKKITAINYRKKSLDDATENLQTHSKLYKCEICSSAFHLSKLLELHILDHSNLHGVKKEDDELYHLSNKEKKCPSCLMVFRTMDELLFHINKHDVFHDKTSSLKHYKCELCYKTFIDEEKLTKHLKVHKSDTEKPYLCSSCPGRFCSVSALGSHFKTHSGDGTQVYECPICGEKFGNVVVFKKHIPTHCINGEYACQICNKKFQLYNQIRKHIRSYHSSSIPCIDCQKVFPSREKLKIHSLSHSDTRNFFCPVCSQGFKRKDKMNEHMKRMHSPNKKIKKPTKVIKREKSTDYEAFLYKCHQCMLGFKRRGMLINHLSKRHPNIEISSVPELNQPIIRNCRSYCCQYCKKSYVSSTKRKQHILKNHPGAEVPSSNSLIVENDPGRTKGIVKVHASSCTQCHRQYATNAKLLQHQRKRHPSLVKDISKQSIGSKNKNTNTAKDENMSLALHDTRSAAAPTLMDHSKIEPSKIISQDMLCQRVNTTENEQFENVGAPKLIDDTASSLLHSQQPQLEENLEQCFAGETSGPQQLHVNDHLLVGVPSTNQIFVTGNIEQENGAAFAVLASDGSDTYTLALRPHQIFPALSSLSMVSADADSESPKDIENLPQTMRPPVLEGSSHIMVTNSTSGVEESSNFQLSALSVRNEDESQVVLWQPFTPLLPSK